MHLIATASFETGDRIEWSVDFSESIDMSQTELQTKETFHLINEPANALHEALNGLTRRQPTLSYAPDYKIVYRSDLEDFRQNNVTTIGFSGGGQ